MRVTSSIALVVLASALAIGSCTEPGAAPSAAPSMRFDDRSSPFAAPFPSEHLRREDGTLDLTALPEGGRVTIVDQIHSALASATGFGTTSAIHLSFDAPVDPGSLPSGVVSADDAVVQLVVVDEERRGERAPVRVFFTEDGGPFGDENVLTVLPVQGVPLHADALYALVVRRGLSTTDGVPFGRARAMDALAQGNAPTGLSGAALASYTGAYAALGDVGIDPTSVIGMTVFRTQDPTVGMRRAVETTRETIATFGSAASRSPTSFAAASSAPSSRRISSGSSLPPAVPAPQSSGKRMSWKSGASGSPNAAR